jgi:hypothetical protein
VCGHRAGRRRGRRRFPESKPPGLNHSVVTGTLIDDPRPGRNPVGEPVTFLRVEFPVADPEHPQLLWTWASCDVEVSEALTEQPGVRELQGGASVMVAGQLSERWMIFDGRTSRRGVIVAALVHPGPPPECDELIVPACPPDAGREPS